MFYAILAYHEEEVVESWTREADAKLMDDLLQVNDRLVREKRLGPAARLGSTRDAVTLRGDGAGMIIDGPFAETK
ncbi:YciI family protein, partial [Sinorhizobium meliloti]